jgi:hypothetical protein
MAHQMQKHGNFFFIKFREKSKKGKKNYFQLRFSFFFLK